MNEFWSVRKHDITEDGNKIAESSDMETQRQAFKPFSAKIIEVYKAFGVSSPVFIQYCPMADEDRGGFWLSDKKQIENPYFGDMMLNCGVVKEEIN